MTMRIRSLVLTLLVGVLAPCAARAQAAPIDSAQIMAVMGASMVLNRPAEFVLHHRSDLALTDKQVAALEALILAQRDSAGARQLRMMTRSLEAPLGDATHAAVAWTGPIDESALQEELCRQSKIRMESMLETARDRRAVAALLTPEQVAQLPGLQSADMMKAVRRP
jgi:Spy/CpxP family protein refolding chaperone